MENQVIKEQYVNLNQILDLFSGLRDEDSYALHTIEDAIYNKELSFVYVYEIPKTD